MPTVVEKIRAICKEKGIPISQLEKALGYANGYLNPKKAANIRLDRLAEIANYLGVSLTDIDENCTENGTIEILQSLSEEERGVLEAARGIEPVSSLYQSFFSNSQQFLFADAFVQIPLCNSRYQADVDLHQLLFSFLVALPYTVNQFQLFIQSQIALHW